MGDLLEFYCGFSVHNFVGLIDPFMTKVSILYSLETPENLWYQMRTSEMGLHFYSEIFMLV